MQVVLKGSLLAAAQRVVCFGTDELFRGFPGTPAQRVSLLAPSPPSLSKAGGVCSLPPSQLHCFSLP